MTFHVEHQADHRSDGRITADEAIARLITWAGDRPEIELEAFVAAALEDGDDADQGLRDAAVRYRAACYRTGTNADALPSNDVEDDAETARNDLREAHVVVDVAAAAGHHDGLGHDEAARLLIDDCHIAARVPRLGGRWVGFGSRPASEETT